MSAATQSERSLRCHGLFVTRPFRRFALRRHSYRSGCKSIKSAVKGRRMFDLPSSSAHAQDLVFYHEFQPDLSAGQEEILVTKNELMQLENELSQGDGMMALAEFNNALRQLTRSDWEKKLKEIFREWCFNLESFNPAFAAVLLQVQLSIGDSDYHRRDRCLKRLIQPLAGEYGMHNNEPQAKTHRQLFEDFYNSLFPESPLETLFSPAPVHAKILFDKMINDIQSHGENSVERASYALGYNLAIEFLADYEKRWMLQSFQQLSPRVIHHSIDWVYLEVHAEDEKEHAAIGHEAVLSFVPKTHLPLLRQAMMDHDRDFAAFYNELTKLLTE